VKVNISYAVELEDVPTETNKLLGECGSMLCRLHEDLNLAIGESPLDLVESLDDIRIGLEGLDRRLADCSRILGGYIELKSQTTHESPTEDESA